MTSQLAHRPYANQLSIDSFPAPLSPFLQTSLRNHVPIRHVNKSTPRQSRRQCELRYSVRLKLIVWTKRDIDELVKSSVEEASEEKREEYRGPP